MFLGGQCERTQSGKFIQPVKVSCHKSLSSTPLKFFVAARERLSCRDFCLPDRI